MEKPSFSKTLFQIFRVDVELDMSQMAQSNGGVDTTHKHSFHILTLSTVHMCICDRP